MSKNDFCTKNKKTHKLSIIHDKLYLLKQVRHHLAYSAAHYHEKAHTKFQPDWSKILGEKVKKSEEIE